MVLLKSVFSYLRIALQFILLRPFGNIIHDNERKYEHVRIQDLRVYEKLRVKSSNCKLHKKFLNSCKPLSFPELHQH